MTEGTRWQFVVFAAVLVLLHFFLRVGMGLGLLVPDLLVVVVLLAARRMRPGQAAGLGFALGLLDDAVAFHVGASALALAVIGYFASRSREVLAGDSPILLVLYVAAGKWAFDLFLYGVLAARGLTGPASELLTVSPLAALYAAAAALAASAAYRSVV